MMSDEYLIKKQKKLNLKVIEFNVEKSWHSNSLIKSLRSKIVNYLPQGLYDPQDLEHQILFRLTTFNPSEINERLVKDIVDEQLLLVKDRMNKLSLKFDLEYIFRGLTSKYHDLNINHRMKLKYEREGKIKAINKNHSLLVEFRKVDNEDIINLFTNDLHYVHSKRAKGEVFGLYFAGDAIPWCIETTEPSLFVKEYKREALLAHGIDPNKAVELTRFYALPGSPLNAISFMDKMITDYYKNKMIEAIFTTTMPMYSKTKATTICGGINKVLLVKDLRHTFIKQVVCSKEVFRHVVSLPEDYNGEIITTHPEFPKTYVVEMFKLINKPSLEELEIFKNKNFVIYVPLEKRDIKYKQKNETIEKEIRFKIENVDDFLGVLEKFADKKEIAYIRDVFFGLNHIPNGPKTKIRMRLIDYFGKRKVEVVEKKKISSQSGIKVESENILYVGEEKEFALDVIKKQGDFKEENSYEKIRVIFKPKEKYKSVEIFLDIYPWGVYCEIEGEEYEIRGAAVELGLNMEHSTTKNADETFLEWVKKFGIYEFWDIRFGLTGKK